MNNAGMDFNQPRVFPRFGITGFCITLLLMSCVNAFVLMFVVPRFVKIFAEFGNPLPAITACVIGYRSVLILLAMVVPAAGVAVTCLAPRPVAFATLWILMLVTFAGIAVTIFAIFLPLVSTVKSMSAG